MTSRSAAIDQFLTRAGWGGAVRAPLAGDASARRYERVQYGPKTAVLMDAPPEPGEAKAGPQGIKASGYSAAARLAVDCKPFVAIAAQLSREGFSAPTLYAEDIAQGLLLLEDLGDELFVRRLGESGSSRDEPMLYEAAVDLLLAMHHKDRPADVPVPGGGTYALGRYEPSVYQVEADLLIDWYLPALRRGGTTDAERSAYRAAWAPALALIAQDQSALCLRDYHAGNLIWLPDRPGPANVGLLDFQDGLLGSAAYDLVSLLQDARRDVSPALEAAMLARYVRGASSIPRFDEGRFRLAYAVLGAQRNAKIVGIFTRLSRRDSKPIYLRHLPRVWRYLTTGLAHPALQELRAWFDSAIPLEQRDMIPSADDIGFGPAQKVAS